MKKCCGGVLQRSVVKGCLEKCCREVLSRTEGVLWRSVVEKRCQEFLWRSDVKKCCVVETCCSYLL